jgi:ankyrin repeat protein
MYAATGPHAKTVNLLLEAGANPDLADNAEGFTALMYAAAEGQLEVVRALLGHGANATLRDKDGDTARDFAARNGHTEIARRLGNSLDSP